MWDVGCGCAGLRDKQARQRDSETARRGHAAVVGPKRQKQAVEIDGIGLDWVDLC